MMKRAFVFLVICFIVSSAFGATRLWDPNEENSNRDMLEPNNWNADIASATGFGISDTGWLAPVLDGDWNYVKTMNVGYNDPGELIVNGGSLNVSYLNIGGDYQKELDEFSNEIAYGHSGKMILNDGVVNASATKVGEGNMGILIVNGGTFNCGAHLAIGLQSFDRLLVSQDGVTGYYMPFRGSGTFIMTGGVVNAEHVLASPYERDSSYIHLSGDASLVVYEDDVVPYDPAESYFRIGDPEAFSELVVEGAATITAGSLSVNSQNSKLSFILDETSLTSPRIIIDNETADNNDISITSSISVSFAGDDIPGTFDLIQSQINLNNENLTGRLTQESSDAGWYLTVVSDGQGGTILQATFYPTYGTCADVIAGGMTYAGDLDKDCDVDFTDVAQLAENWLKTNDPESADFVANW